jgi:multiple sugar transport system ATP-binding protein
MNFFSGTLRREGGHVAFVEDNKAGTPLTVALDESLARKASDHMDKPIIFGIRPEAIHDALTVASPEPGRTAEVKVEVSEPMGSETLLYLDTGATSFIARVNPTDRFEAGQKVKVTLDLANAHLFDATSELALT